MMLVDKETGKGYVEMEKVHHDKKEYASKGVAGTALGLGLIDIETLLGKSIDNLIVSPVQEYPDMFKGVTIGNGKIRIGLPGINKDIVLDANDIETFKQSLVK